MGRRFLSPDRARRIYDRIGARQDSQSFYEDRALETLVAAAGFAEASRVLELACGTGRFARRLLTGALPGCASYVACDLSSRMAELASARLRNLARPTLVLRASVLDGLPFADARFDRLVSTYLLDLLPDAALPDLFAEMHRVLRPGGCLAMVGITPGVDLRSRLVMGGWSLVHRLAPALVGGCRPLELAPLLDSDRWRLEHREAVVSWGVASEVLVATAIAGRQHDPSSWPGTGPEGGRK